MSPKAIQDYQDEGEGEEDSIEIEEQECLIALRQLIADCNDELILEDEKFLDDETLLIPIRCRKYDVPSAFEKLKRITYARKVKYPETFMNFYPSHCGDILQLEGKGVLKQRDAKGRQILFLRASSWDPNTISFEDMLLALMLMGFEMAKSKETQLKGITLLIDVAGFNVKQARHITPSVCAKYADLILHSSPLKIKEVHLMNASRFFGISLSLIKMFLPQKLRKRLYSHGASFPSLHKHLSPEILPESQGGLLSETEALDNKLIDDLFTPEKEEWYKVRRFQKENL